MNTPKQKRANGRETQSETSTRRLIEGQIPVRATQALAVAARKAKNARHATMIVSNDSLILVTADGQRSFVKSVAPNVRVEPGRKIRL